MANRVEDRFKLPRLLALSVLVAVVACQQTRSVVQLQSAAGDVTAVYELHRGVDLASFLEKQPPASADALIMEVIPPPIIVIARVSLASTPLDSQSPRFTTTFQYADGTRLSKSWQGADSRAQRRDYRAIFGLPHEVVKADTVLRR